MLEQLAAFLKSKWAYALILITAFLSSINTMLLTQVADTSPSQPTPTKVATLPPTATVGTPAAAGGAGEPAIPTRVPTWTPVPVPTPAPTVTEIPVEMGTNLYFSNIPYPFAKMPEDWTISYDGLKFIEHWEGYYSTMYNDGNTPNDPGFYDRSGNGVGNCTIGFGHLLHLGPCDGRSVEAGWTGGISLPTAEKLLEQELNHCGSKYVAQYVKVRITQTQYNILSGLVCGWGYDRFRGSQVVALLNDHQYVEAAETLKTTAVYGIGIGLCPGLVRRRLTESEMFLRPPGFLMIPFQEVYPEED